LKQFSPVDHGLGLALLPIFFSCWRVSQMTSPTHTPEQSAKRWHQRLRRELIWAIALKLVVLFSLKAAFFPHRLPAADAATGVAERIASSSAPTLHEPHSKDQP